MRLTLAVLAFSVGTGASAAPPSPAPPAASDTALEGLQFRNIGPALMGGRIDDFAVQEDDPSVFYVATASGGLWKTTNHGTTFDPIFDDQSVSSIGDVTLAPSDPSILYVGTGEPNNRQSSSWGNGVYRSLDGGATWTHLGLTETHHIGRVVVSPRDPDVAYVAALGRLWGASKERGLYKTTDGGRTWTQSKAIDDDTGFVDVALDPLSPHILYAASYQRRRTPHGYNGGGPGSGLWKSGDAGATWKKLTSGLPRDGDIGRIGIAVYRRDPRIVYALVEHAKEGGIYRSDDRGETWKKQSDTNPRPSYYSKVHIDPNNDQRVWVLGAPLYYSEDGGRTFKTDRGQKIHGDYHAFWIDPRDSDHMLVGTDGGIHLTHDRGQTWDFVNTVALAQFYEVHFDMRQPYWVCGGLQDNGSWCGPSRTFFQQGIGNEDWYRVGGGDGFYTVVDPSDHNIVYVESQDGNVQRFDMRTSERRLIRPEPSDPQERYRFNWNSPILISPHDPATIYYGGNRLFGSKDRGDSWTLATPDLTHGAERDSLTIFGKAAKDMLSRNDGVVHWGTITTLAESPLKAGVLWAGTDDGRLQVTKDGGATWSDVSPRVPGVPKGTYVSRVEASRSGEGAAYVSFDGHRGNDFKPYVFRTEDYGQTWSAIASNLPVGGVVNVVRELPADANVLLAGTEHGLWVSTDRGGRWRRVRAKLPTVPVDDIRIHPRDQDLIVGTHGRGVFILDDATSVLKLDEGKDADLHLYAARTAVQYRIYGHKGNTGHKTFLAPNPPEGALLTYRLKAKPGEKDEVKVVIKDAAGEVVRELKGSKDMGLNRVNWDLRHEPPVKPEPGAGGGGFFGPPRGPLVPPGAYTVTVSTGAFSANRPLTVQEDPRITIAEADRREWYEAARTAAKQWTRADALNKTLESLQKQATALQDSWKKEDATKPPEAVTAAVKALADKVDPLAKRMSRQTPLGFAGAPLAVDPDPLLARARGAYFVLTAMTAPPTSQHKNAFARLGKDLDEVASAVNELVEKEVPALNRLMLDHGIGRLDQGKAIR
jgi:photosystem II stability/assembly factor-like uncharacterized protein